MKRRIGFIRVDENGCFTVDYSAVNNTEGFSLEQKEKLYRRYLKLPIGAYAKKDFVNACVDLMIHMTLLGKAYLIPMGLSLEVLFKMKDKEKVRDVLQQLLIIIQKSK